MMRVKPRDGLQVRDTLTKRLLPAEGGDVPETTYWLRRLRAGDVVPIEPAPPVPVLTRGE